MAKREAGFPNRMVTTSGKALSRGFCVTEFDRKKAQADGMSQAEQHKHDLHFTGVAYDRRDPVVWVGLTSFLGDILWTFDPKTKKFESRNFTPRREKEEVKVHRGLQVGPDGMVYFGTASLVTIPQRHGAPGGRLFRYDPNRDTYEFLGRPVEHDYIQTIDVDYQRGIVYGATYPVGNFFGWDLEKRRPLFSAFLDDWPHQVIVDDDGVCWATYSTHMAARKFRLVSYSPKTGKLNWTDVALPGDTPQQAAGIDSFVNGGDGFLYIGATTGALLRLEPRKVRVELILRPAASQGFGALAPPVDGVIYGIAGTGATSQVFSYNVKTSDVVLYGCAWDNDRRTGIYRPHELVLGPNRALYCPETDNPERQCYFWEIRLR